MNEQEVMDYVAELAWRRSRTLVLVACVSQKLDCEAMACELYVSDWFKKARRYARVTGDMMILSAEHGLVDPDDIIEPYDTTLNDMTHLERLQWAARVVAQLEGLLAERKYDRVIVLAGRNYRDNLITYLDAKFGTNNVEVPLAGLGIGQQKSKLMELCA